ncbi:MAG: hypothetical protein RKE49_14670 [Oceanicaulis sp.]
MTQRADQADQTAGAGVGPSRDGVSGAGGGHGSGQTGARVTLGAILVVCVVGVGAVLWPDNPASSIQAAERANDMGEDGQVVVAADAVVNRQGAEIPPAREAVEGPDPEPAATGPEASGQGLSETPPDMNPAGAENAAPDVEIDPAETVSETEDPAGR